MAILLGLVLLAGVLIPGSVRPAYADTYTCAAPMDGSQESPPVETEGEGSASLTFDSETNELSWEIEFSELSGPATGAHFHGPAPEGENAGVQIDIGEISGLDSPMVGSAELTEEQATYLLDGLLYINIHTQDHPDGEIRGQVNCEAEVPPEEEEEVEVENGDWQTMGITYGDREFEIQFMIVNGTLNELIGDADVQMVTAMITADSEGELMIQLPREMIDSTADEEDIDYMVFVDEQIELFAEDDFGEEVRTLTIPFFEGSEVIDIVSASVVPVEDVDWEVAAMMIEETEYDLQYLITGGTLDEVTADPETATIMLTITADEDGELTIRLPRDVADSKDGPDDTPFVVMIDGEEVEVAEDSTARARILTINFNEGASEIAVMGTFVVPEFGPIAAIVLAVAIVGTIVATTRYSNRFDFMSRM